jgi:hypothetical protein
VDVFSINKTSDISLSIGDILSPFQAALWILSLPPSLGIRTSQSHYSQLRNIEVRKDICDTHKNRPGRH